MAAGRIYLDESVAIAVAAALRARGVDAWTARDAGNRGLTDEEQLAYATAEGAVILTRDDDFLRLHDDYVREGRSHGGIFFLGARRRGAGELAQFVSVLALAADEDEFRNRVEFL